MPRKLEDTTVRPLHYTGLPLVPQPQCPQFKIQTLDFQSHSLTSQTHCLEHAIWIIAELVGWMITNGDFLGPTESGLREKNERIFLFRYFACCPNSLFPLFRFFACFAISLVSLFHLFCYFACFAISLVSLFRLFRYFVFFLENRY